MKQKVAIAMGGYSSEYEISIKSGNFIFQELDREKFEVYKAFIMKDHWYVEGEDGREYPLNKADFSVTMNGDKLNFDCVFNMIHGTPGENGPLQGYFEILGIPQTASDFYPSALSFDKHDCISVLRNHGIRTAENYFIQKGDAIDEDKIIEKVGLPCFVKANSSGSSFGISKVKQQSDLAAAIEHSFKEGNDIIIESFLDGVEVDVGVIQYNNTIIALPVTEIVTENEFFDYGAKYLGQSEEITPARISNEQTAEVQEMSKKIFKLLRLKGFARAEFILHQGKPHFIEINTVPGMSPASVVPQQIRAADISFEDFFSDLIYTAIAENA